MHHKQFSQYKSSNIDWIGDIPSDWELEKLKHILLERNEKNNPTKTNNILSLTAKQGVIPISEKEHVGGNKPKDDLTQYKLAYPNDIVLNSMNIISGAVGLSKYYGCVSPVYYMLYTKDNNINIEYYNYIFKIKSFQRMLLKFGKGILIRKSESGKLNTIRMKIPIESFKDLELPLIDIETQNAIVNYLNQNIALIDNKISKFEELIDLLEEKRVALINQVVTKGLNPDVPMKDSGVEWIGEIPEHWKTNKIKNMSYVKGRIGWHGLTSEEYSDEGAYLVTGTDFKEGIVDWEHCNHISYERYKQDPNIHLKTGDLLITKDGTIGKLALIKDIPDKATLNSGIFLVRPLKDNYTNDYLYWILSSDIFVRFFDYIKTGATIAHLYQETFERFFFPFPHIDEQNLIVQYLNDNVSKINLTIHKVEENIALLEEYKTSLIHHVVTGKIDVRSEKI